ncbi:MAG TPA: hypothetical protein VEQ35_10760 [Beijerinckia sp.]|jgi:hypothetical protein|nr:hypothetical protein [Beijerinckia sp.]
MTLPEGERQSGLRRVLLWLAESLVIFYVALDAIIVPLFRPFLRWFAKLWLVIRFEEFVATLPAYGILVLLAIPFVIAEPAKVYALYLLGTGHVTIGLVTMAGAYLLSLVLVERVYQAGRAKLKTIGWFAKFMNWLVQFRDQLSAWAKSTRIWAMVTQLKRGARLFIARLRPR